MKYADYDQLFIKTWRTPLTVQIVLQTFCTGNLCLPALSAHKCTLFDFHLIGWCSQCLSMWDLLPFCGVPFSKMSRTTIWKGYYTWI